MKFTTATLAVGLCASLAAATPLDKRALVTTYEIVTVTATVTGYPPAQSSAAPADLGTGDWSTWDGVGSRGGNGNGGNGGNNWGGGNGGRWGGGGGGGGVDATEFTTFTQPAPSTESPALVVVHPSARAQHHPRRAPPTDHRRLLSPTHPIPPRHRFHLTINKAFSTPTTSIVPTIPCLASPGTTEWPASPLRSPPAVCMRTTPQPVVVVTVRTLAPGLLPRTFPA